MSAVPEQRVRTQTARPDEKGRPTFDWTLTSSSITDTVRLVIRPDVLPVIFVPGIMGSNLCSKDDAEPVWRLDKGALGLPTALIGRYVGTPAGDRQRWLHPDRVEVDPEGNVPRRIDRIGDAEVLRQRGWGQVGEDSYQEFLIWLDETLNPGELNPARWHEFHQTQATVGPIPQPGEEPSLFPGIRMGLQGEPFGAQQEFESLLTDDLLKRSKYWMPVHAVGYNWLDSNQTAAQQRLKPEIDRIISEYNRGVYSCKQVVLVTHSMGGLVARACAQLPGMADKIAGIVHGVMPAVGAAVAYRRCKVGMADEDARAAMVMGNTGQEVTAVFAQAPGALQLLPSQDYTPGWLRITHQSREVQSFPKVDPYTEIYLRRDRWWGLVNEAWLAPRGGISLRWERFEDYVLKSRKFHIDIGGKYHLRTFCYYGADPKQRSFENVTWRLRPGNRPDDGTAAPSVSQVMQMPASQLRTDGSTPEHVGGRARYVTHVSPMGSYSTALQYSHWELHCEQQDSDGDGTVPQSSGAAPGSNSGVKQVFRLSGFGHEAAYRESMVARRATLYSITKIAGTAQALG